MTNPYRPPGAVVGDRDRPTDSPIKGIIYGALIDILGTTAASMILGMGYGIFLTASGASIEDLERLSAQIDPTSAIGLVGGAIGCGFSVFGGYVCARVAGRPELRWAAVVGAISAGSGLLMGMQSPVELNLLLNGVGFAMVMLGGYLGARRNARLER